MKKATVFFLILWVLALIEEVKCIIKAAKCNWEPIGKAEIIYTASAFTGVGAVVGWIDIKDN